VWGWECGRKEEWVVGRKEGGIKVMVFSIVLGRLFSSAIQFPEFNNDIQSCLQMIGIYKIPHKLASSAKEGAQRYKYGYM
jgi:hypothetical protein